MRLAVLLFLGLFLLAESAGAADRVTMILGTVGAKPSDRMNIVNGQLPDERPGWFAELSRRAGDECGADVDFAFMPWPRALELVKNGKIAAAFNSSYKAERAEYGIYPMADGKPDEARASKFYAYYVYLPAEKRRMGSLVGATVAVERQAAIISRLERQGAVPYQVASYTTMLRMVARGRVPMAIGIGTNLDPILAADTQLAKAVKKLPVPIEKKIGFVMFSRFFYDEHPELVQCFWDKSAALKKTDWFKKLRASYEADASKN